MESDRTSFVLINEEQQCQIICVYMLFYLSNNNCSKVFSDAFVEISQLASLHRGVNLFVMGDFNSNLTVICLRIL